jgi:hypothetical protein
MSKWQQAPEVADLDEAQPKWAEAPPVNRQWSDVAKEAKSNLGSSALGVAQSFIEPFLHPIDTLGNLADLGNGLVSKIAPADSESWTHGRQQPGKPADEAKAEREQAADAVGQHISSRFGSMEGFKEALAKDPVGVAADLSTVLTGVGGVLSRAPGAIGRAGRAMQAADPVNQAGRLASYGAGRLFSESAGVSTGMGTRPFDEAAEAGRQPGGSAEFRRHVTDQPGIRTEVVEMGRQGVQNITQQRNQAFDAALQPIMAQGGQVNYSPVYNALSRVRQTVMHKGLDMNPQGVAVLDEIERTVDNYSVLAGSGLDDAHALKRAIGVIYEATEEGTPARNVARQAYDAVRAEIEGQAGPAYRQMNQAYQAANHDIDELRRSLRLGENATDDSALRALQSTMRNNAYTSWGQRSDLLDQLATQGGQADLPAALAGQSLAQWAPRGLMRSVAPAFAGAAGGAAAATGGLGPLAALPLLLAASPRAMGEVAYGVNRVRGILERAGVPPEQINRILYASGEMSQSEGEKDADKSKRLREILMRRAAADRGQ